MQFGRKSFVVVLLLTVQWDFLQGQTLNVVQTATYPSLTTLIAALNVTNLSNALLTLNSLTIFAPTNDAFDQLAAGVVDDLLKTENNRSLSEILLYHAVNANISSSSINWTSPMNVTSLQGSTLALVKNGSAVRVNAATVIFADLHGTNGILHVIDKVLFPPLDIVDTALTVGNFRTLISALRAAGFLGTLQAAGPFTVFAPTDAAFGKLGNAALVDLLRPANKEKLVNILKYHIVPQRLAAANLPATVTTLAGSTLTITRNGSMVEVNAVTVAQVDIATTNGLIHSIDTVLMPPISTSPVATLFDSSICLLIVSRIFSHFL